MRVHIMLIPRRRALRELYRLRKSAHPSLNLHAGSEYIAVAMGSTVSLALMEARGGEKLVRYADAVPRIEQATCHFAEVGLGADYVG